MMEVLLLTLLVVAVVQEVLVLKVVQAILVVLVVLEFNVSFTQSIYVCQSSLLRV